VWSLEPHPLAYWVSSPDGLRSEVVSEGLALTSVLEQEVGLDLGPERVMVPDPDH
jgi:hypothetical protein